MSREEKIATFDPNGPGSVGGSLYGLPFSLDEAQVVVVPVPWDVTVSYADGSAKGPGAIWVASAQVDLFDPSVPDAWKIGLAMDEISDEVQSKGQVFRKAALAHQRERVNEGSAWLNAWVTARCATWLDAGKLVALLGGDHSTPLGFMQALAERHGSFAILQIDAHADLRDAYEGFECSHASIMRNALKIPGVSRLVQVGVRDYCDEEAQFIARNPERVATFFDRDLKHAQYGGVTWAHQVSEVVAQLPDKVYVSFDIDGLDPKLCPNSGTPVAGGFEFEQAAYLIERVARSGKTIIGVDLNEVAPGREGGEWDANVGARMLYRLCNLMAFSNGRA